MKKRINKLIICVCFICLTFCIISCGNNNSNKMIESDLEEETTQIFTDYPYYDSLNELADNSDVIIVGEVIGKKCEEKSLLIKEEGEDYSEDQLNDKDKVTITEIKVVEEFTDSLDRSDLSIIQLGGSVDKKTVINENAAELLEGDSYLLFLKKSKKWDNTYWLLNENQSAFEVDKDNMIIKSDTEGLSFDWLKKYCNKGSK